MSANFLELSKDLPRPVDDGAASHLHGIDFPRFALPATNGANVDLAAIPGRLVIYIYRMTGRPSVPLPDGWDSIPGARGCTPPSCSFRDHYSELQSLNTSVFGLSVQTSEYQKEARDRSRMEEFRKCSIRFFRPTRVLTKFLLGYGGTPNWTLQTTRQHWRAPELDVPHTTPCHVENDIEATGPV